MTVNLDEDALDAAIDLAGRSGARNLEIGFVHDDVPAAEAGWWAHAQLRGARISVEDHRGPAQAAEALAERMLSGAMCTHCGGLTTLRDDGACVHIGHLSDGSQMTVERARSMRHCRWRRVANRWVRGCTDTHPEGRRTAPAQLTPNRAAPRRTRERTDRG